MSFWLGANLKWVITLPAAHLLYQHVERPGIALGRRIAAHRAGR